MRQVFNIFSTLSRESRLLMKKIIQYILENFCNNQVSRCDIFYGFPELRIEEAMPIENNYNTYKREKMHHCNLKMSQMFNLFPTLCTEDGLLVKIFKKNI